MGIDLTGYKEAMLFSGSEIDKVGLRLASIAYAKQLLICVGKDIDKRFLDVQVIKKMFLEEDAFEHLHKLFETGWTSIERRALLDCMYNELIKYVSEDELDYEPEDLDIWWRDMIRYTIQCVDKEVSKDMAEYLKKFDSYSTLNALWWISTDIFECTGYAWLGKNAAIMYGYVEKKDSDTFIMWCELNGIKDRASEKERLYKLFKVNNDMLLDAALKMNMPG